MDEAYASPDSDGHASLPSPTDTTFDLNDLPLKRRGRKGEHEPIIISSSFLHTEEDSDDDGYIPKPKTDKNDADSMQSSPPGMENRSNILAPVDANDPNSQRRQTRNVSGSLLAQEGPNENTDPEGNGVGGKTAADGKSEPARESSNGYGPPDPIVVKKYRGGASVHREDSTRHGAHSPQGTQSPESGSSAPEEGDSTVISKIQDASSDSRSLIPVPIAGSSRRIGLRRARGSPDKIAASSPVPPSSEQGTPSPSQLLDYRQWLNSDEYCDDSIDGSDREECSARTARVRGSQADAFAGESGFVGGDEASFISGKDIEFTSDEIEILGEEFSRNSPFARRALLGPLRLPEEVVRENAEHDLSLVSSIPEELPASPDSSKFSDRPHESPAMESNESTRLDNPRPGTSTGSSEKTEHSTEGSTESNTGLTGIGPINPGYGGLSSGSDKSALIGPAESMDSSQSPGDHISKSVPDYTSQLNPPTTISLVVKGGSSSSTTQSTSNQSALRPPAQKENSSEPSCSESAVLGPGSMPRSTPVTNTGASQQVGPSRDSSPSSGKAVIQDSDPEAPSIRLSRSSSPSLGPAEFCQTGGDDPFPETTARNISSFQADFSHSKIYSAALIATSTPRNRYEPDYVTKLKQGGNVRRVSMNTPPSASPKSISATEVLAHSPRFSSLGSGFDFPTEPLRLSNWDSPDASLEFSPILPIDRSHRSNGDEPPPNTANLTPTPHVVGGKGRTRSRSVPVDSTKGNVQEKRLFDPGRLGENVPEEITEKPTLPPSPSFAQSTPSNINRGSRSRGGDDETRDSFDDDGNRRGIWSEFSEDLSFRPEADAPETVGANPETRSLNFGDDLYQLDIPHSVGEDTKDSSHEDDSSQPSRALLSPMSRPEVLGDELLKLLQNGNINSEQPEGQSESMSMPTIGQGSTLGQSLPSGTRPEVLQAKITQLEGVVKLLSKLEQEHRLARQEQETLVFHWKNQHTEVHQTVQVLEGCVERLEKEVRKNMEEREAQAKSHSAMVDKMSMEHQEEVLKHRQQASMSLEERIKYYEERYKQHQKEAEEKDRTVAHLRQALEMSAHNLQQAEGVGSDQQLRNVIIQLEDRLKNAEESHRAELEVIEAKYTNILEERGALVKHLQAELDEMVNLMPVDHGSSRMIEEEEADEWLEEKSREISQYYDDGLAQIITELHGGGEREDFDEAAEEAEMSLRRVAEEAGLDEPLDKATLAAFGIRQLRTEYVLLKRLLIESEGRVKELMQANDEMGRRGEQMRSKVGVLEGEKEAIKRTVAEAEEKAKKHSEELEALKAKLAEMEKRIRQLTLEKGELSKKNRDLEDRAKALEGDKSSLQRLVSDTKRLNEILKTQHSEEEKRAQSFEEEILGLRRQLAEENEHVGVIETETLSLRQQMTELEESSALLEKSKQDLEARVKRIPSLEKEIRFLESKLADLETAGNEGGSEDLEALSRQLQSLEEKLRLSNDQHQISTSTVAHLQQTLSTTELATRKLTKEKECLKKDLDKAAQESKASRIRFAQLLHDTAEKEAKWNASRQAQDSQSHRQTAAFEDLLSEIYDEEILAQVGGDKMAMLREVLERKGRAAGESEEKVRRYKAAAKKWANECERNKGRIEELVAEVKELGLRLKAEKKSCDEKMGQLILALRRE
ncbi:unnamed protein product [Tuber aestivum]|uniref:Uncharacterized protein n=1 Tax=Tuber aestivum TaxID=59557 RepID=A0A292PIY3_9PEZI|nr:unnamed protein product [Tuber aestivum]